MYKKSRPVRKLLGVLLTLAVVFSTLSGIMPKTSATVFAAEHGEHYGVTFNVWESDNGLPTTAGNYYLTQDVTISRTWNVPGETKLCLNGHSITLNADSGAVVNIKNGATLNLYDCGDSTYYYTLTDGVATGITTEDKSTDGNYESFTGGYITGGKDSGVLIEKNGTLNMYGGTIIGNIVAGFGGGVCVDDYGKFNMYSGSILGNKVEPYGGDESGGGVYINIDGTFNMQGGLIAKNNTNGVDTRGGGVCCLNGEFVMSSGKIEQNSATYGGGVYDGQYVTVRGDAEITNNRSETLGGGLFINEYGHLTISGSVKITDNKNGAVDNNVYIPANAGGLITIGEGLLNTSSIGVSMESPGVFTNNGSFESKEAAQAVFSSDDSDYEVIADEYGEAKLKNVPLKYIQRSWNGSTVTETEKTVEDYNVLSEYNSTGWYVVKGNVTFNDRIKMNGVVNLILCDGATLTATRGIEVSEGNTLNIYGQSGDTGTLTATGEDQDWWSSAPPAGIGVEDTNTGNAGIVNIHGGNVIATGATYVDPERKAGGAGIGGCGNGYSSDDRDDYNGGTVNIYGGIVTATGGAYAAGIGGGGSSEDAYATKGADVNIYGGTVTTIGGVNAVGIGGGSYRNGERFSEHGSLELGAGMYLYGNNYEEHPENDANNHRKKSGGDYVRTRYMTVNNVAPPHSHSFKYSFDGATITATCTNTDGRHSGDASSTLTIVAPTLTTYGGTGNAVATIEGSIDGVTNPDIVYKNGDTVLGAAPTDAGTYTANITFENVALTDGGTGDVTATVEYTIAPATLTGVSVEQSGTLTYTGEAQTPEVTTSATAVNDQTVTFTYSTTENGTYGSMPTVTNVNDCGTIYYKASAPNHSDVTGSFTVSMNKADQEKPDAPTKISATISSITLNVIEGFEYRIEGGEWQDSNEFSGLSMNTPYNFYQRIKGDDNYNASPESDAAVLRTNDHSHEWTYTSNSATITATCGNSDDGHSGDTSSTLTIVAPTLTTYGGTGDASATIEGNIEGVANPDIVYKNGDTVLDAAPTDAGTYTANITFENVALTDGGTGDVTATVEYTIAPATLTGVSVEQSGTLTYTGEAQTPEVTTSATAVDGQSITFTYSLTEDGTYGDMPTVINVNDCGTIYYKASAPNHGDVTGSFTVSMNKADRAKPDAPTKISATISSITLDIIDGFEYKISTGDWQDSNVFSGLDMNTEYSFYQRIKGDDNYNASPESDAAVLRTNDHSHEWTYTSNSATITATCDNTDGGHSGDTVSTLTIVAPTLTTYGGTDNAVATIEGSIDGVTNPDIVYKNGDTVLGAAPTDAGTYTANITFENVALTDGGTGDVTATVEYTIAPATLTGVSVEQSGTLTYTGAAQTPVVTASATAVNGQSITFTYSLTQDGTYGDMPTVTNVNDCGTIYYKASAPNHNEATGSFTVRMNKADKEAPAAPTATSTSVNSITLDSIPNGRYKLGDGEWQTSPTFTGLEMNTSYTFYQKYAEDSNYNESLPSVVAYISTSNHVHEWSYQADGTTITATCADTDGGHGTPNTATLTLIRPELTKYGGTESAEVTFTGGIDGVVPVVVYKKGNDVLDGAPTDAGSYTASVTIDGVTASIEYEIEKADAPVLSDGQKPTKNENIIYDGTEKELITGPDDNITGYTMKYAVTTTDTVPDDSEFDTSIPNETNAGTYYVWYKAFADNSNNCKDTEPASLLVNIAPRKVTVSGIIALDKTYDGTDSAILDYSNVTFDGIVDDDTLTVSATGKFVDSDVSVDGSGEVVAKIVNITGLILDGADVDNYELAQDGQQTTTTATIKKKAATVTALDQIVAVEGNIDDSLDMAVLDGAVVGHKLAEIKLTSGSTASATADGVITPGEAKIVSGDVDVTDNYEITYINGVMTVTKADSEVILDKTSVGEDTSVAAVESPNLQEFADKLAEDGKLVKVELNVKPVAEDELEADAVSGIKAAADKLFANVGKETVKIEYLEIDMTKYVDGIKQGAISDTNTPIEIVVTYDTNKAKNPVVIRRHDGAVSVFDLLSSKPAGSYKDASYYLEGNKIHIYSQYFSDFAIVYSVEKTFNVNLDNGMDEVIRVIVPEGTKYTPPKDLTRDGYDFGGWYKDETFTEKWNPDTDTVTADMKLFVKWIKKADTVTPADNGSSTTPADNGSSSTPATPATTQTVTPAATNTTPAADTTKKSVDTGDHSHVAVAIMLMIDSVLAAVYLTLLKRKRLK